MNWFKLVKYLLTILSALSGFAVCNMAGAGGYSAQVGGLALPTPAIGAFLAALAMTLIQNTLPAGIMQRLALSIVEDIAKKKGIEIDPKLLEQVGVIVDHVKSDYQTLADIYKRYKASGASEELLKSVENLAKGIQAEQFKADFDGQ